VSTKIGDVWFGSDSELSGPRDNVSFYTERRSFEPCGGLEFEIGSEVGVSI